jgi:hypothetical protein
MREVSYLCTIAKRDGKITVLPVDQMAANERSTFMIEAGKTPGAHVIIRMKMLSGKKLFRERLRAGYFSYLADCIDQGNESWTKHYTGNMAQRVNQLHTSMKYEYCKLNPDHYNTIIAMVDGVKQNVQTVFTLSDKTDKETPERHLSDAELETYVKWAKQMLFDLTQIPYQHAMTA